MWPTGRPGNEAPWRGGFTLIELVLVMALLSVVLALAWPSLRDFFRGRDLDLEARRFLALTRYGQSRAVGEGVPMVLWIDVKRGQYGLQAQAGYLAEDDRALEFELGERLEFEVSAMPVVFQGLERRQTAVMAGNLPAIRFTPDGYVGLSSPAEVVIRQGERGAVWIVRSTNRLNYAIEANHGRLARR